MPWQPPQGVVPTDRKTPSGPTLADLPAVLDWLRGYYPGHTVLGTMITARDAKITYRVDAEPAWGTAGTLQNYTLTAVDWNRNQVDAAISEMGSRTDTALTSIAQQQAANNAQATLTIGLRAHTGASNTIPTEKGTYRIIGGSDTEIGRVYERKADGSLVRVPKLEPPRPTYLLADYGIYPDADPTATSTALQQLLDSLPTDGKPLVVEAEFGKNYNLNRTPILTGRSNVLIRGKNNTFSLTVGAAMYCGFMVTAVPVDLAASTPNRGLQFLKDSFATTTPVKNVFIEGFEFKSATGTRGGTMPFFYFADQSGVRDVTVDHSDGSGVNFYCCDEPVYHNLTVKFAGGYGVFLYQCYASDGNNYRMTAGGRWIIAKEAHGRHVGGKKPHMLVSSYAADLVGFPAVN